MNPGAHLVFGLPSAAAAARTGCWEPPLRGRAEGVNGHGLQAVPRRAGVLDQDRLRHVARAARRVKLPRIPPVLIAPVGGGDAASAQRGPRGQRAERHRSGGPGAGGGSARPGAGPDLRHPSRTTGSTRTKSATRASRTCSKRRSARPRSAFAGTEADLPGQRSPVSAGESRRPSQRLPRDPRPVGGRPGIRPTPGPGPRGTGSAAGHPPPGTCS